MRYERVVVVLLSLCDRNISGYIRSVEISDVFIEVDFILARVLVFSFLRDIVIWIICLVYRFLLGIGWRRGVNRCRVFLGLFKYVTKGKLRKVDRGIGKVEFKVIL